MPGMMVAMVAGHRWLKWELGPDESSNHNNCEA